MSKNHTIALAVRLNRFDVGRCELLCILSSWSVLWVFVYGRKKYP